MAALQTRQLSAEDRSELEGCLSRESVQNLFHLSALREHGLSATPERDHSSWAIGAYRDGTLVGSVLALQGTGGIYHNPGDDETLASLARVVQAKVEEGRLTLLSGHASQVKPLVDRLEEVEIEVGPVDWCIFRTLDADSPKSKVQSPMYEGESITLDVGISTLELQEPRLATFDDMERLIDFYEVGFYSLARLPTREAWRARLTEQLAHRTLFVIENNDGTVCSAALSSAQAYAAAMLGGVATLHEYRGKGLSTLCVGALCDYLFKNGTQTVALFYLGGNNPAGRVYDKLGFKADGEWMLVPVGRGTFFKPLLSMSGQ